MGGAPGAQCGIGAVTAAQAIVSSPTTPDDAKATPRSLPCQAPLHPRQASSGKTFGRLLRRFQRIAHWGACRKTPSAEQNHVLEAKRLQKVGLQKCGICCRLRSFARASNRWSDSRYSCGDSAQRGG